jgi:capsular polysaccharide transport system permease protein
MTSKLKATRFRIRRPEFPAAEAEPAPPATTATAADAAPFAAAAADDGFGTARFPTAAAPAPAGDDGLDAIRKEGLTGRQLRLARRIAQKHGLPATSDHDAVRLLRQKGIDPFARGSILELVTAEDGAADTPAPEGRALAVTGRAEGPQLPQAARAALPPSADLRPPMPPRAEGNHAADLLKIQQDIARRRRRRAALLAVRLGFLVGLPTLLCAWYFFLVATPLFATRSEFVIQQAANPVAGAAAPSLFTGSPMATQQDSIAVQGYLQSREAMQRLDADHGFVAHFSAAGLDPILRLPEDATQEDAYALYQRMVQIAYDPTEGIVKLEVKAADPQASATFATALIGYAEGQVDQLTQRLREDAMQGARDSYAEAEANMQAAQRRVVDLQEQFKVLSSEVEVELITAQITQMETMLTTEKLSLEQMRANPNPSAARMEPVERRIAALEQEIAGLRAKLTESTEGGQSIAEVQGELLIAQADVQTRQMILAQALQSMETARIEANRQVRYLSLAVSPTPPDEATYPRATASTAVAALIFLGIYLMVSMTVAILREQVTA